MSGLLEGKRVLIPGVITDTSIAFHAAKVAQEQGAEVVLTGGPAAWSGRPGVVGVTATPDGVHVRVRPDDRDALIEAARRAGWSVRRS